MNKIAKLPDELKLKFTTQRMIGIFDIETGRLIKKETRSFKPLLQSVEQDEIQKIIDIITKRYDNNFTIDVLKRNREEKFILCRVSFLNSTDSKLSGRNTLIISDETYEILYDNHRNNIKKKELSQIAVIADLKD